MLKDNAARERAKVFGNDVKEAVRSLFPNYDLNARTNRSVDGREREPPPVLRRPHSSLQASAQELPCTSIAST